MAVDPVWCEPLSLLSGKLTGSLREFPDHIHSRRPAFASVFKACATVLIIAAVLEQGKIIGKQGNATGILVETPTSSCYRGHSERIQTYCAVSGDNPSLLQPLQTRRHASASAIIGRAYDSVS
jgi:hypothetical protein